MRGNETVWLIEPDEVVRKMVAGMLTADGYRVTAVGTCDEAPQDGDALKAVQLLIATLDREEEKLARRILAQRPSLRVLAIGDHEGEDEVVSWLPADHQLHLVKPYALSALLRGARKLLDGETARPK